jgi:hypothetical protein
MKKVIGALLSLVYSAMSYADPAVTPPAAQPTAPATAAPVAPPATTNLPTLSVDDVSADEDKKSLVFTITKKGIIDLPVSVNYCTRDITTTSGTDYIPVSGTLVFTPAQTQQMITVTLLSDNTFEGPELLTLDLDKAVNATIQDGQGLGTISDDSELLQ